MHIMWIYQGLVVGPDGVGPDPTLKENPILENTESGSATQIWNALYEDI